MWETRQLLEDLITSLTPPFKTEGVAWFCSESMALSDVNTIYLVVTSQSGEKNTHYISRTLRGVFGNLSEEIAISFFDRHDDLPGVINVEVKFYLESAVALRDQLKSKMQ